MSYRHTPDMGEISGFGEGGDPGGVAYEKVCQDMLEAGVEWLMKHPTAYLQVLENENVFGIIIPHSDDAKELETVLFDASYDPETGHEEATGGMMHTVMLRVMYIAQHGWDKYCDELRKGDDHA